MSAIYELKTPVTYQDGGDNVEGKSVVLTAPPGREKKYSMRLKAGVMKASQAIAKMADAKALKPKDVEDAKIDGMAMVQMFYMAPGFEYEAYFENFGKLLCAGVCKFEGSDKKLTDAWYQEITQDDIEGMLGVYLENFILPSLGMS